LNFRSRRLAMKIPTERTLLIYSVGAERKSRRGDPYVECRTNVGVVAFWGGGRNRANIGRLQNTPTPVRLTTECIDPSEGYAQRHAVWVPQTSALRFLPGKGVDQHLPLVRLPADDMAGERFCIECGGVVPLQWLVGDVCWACDRAAAEEYFHDFEQNCREADDLMKGCGADDYLDLPDDPSDFDDSEAWRDAGQKEWEGQGDETHRYGWLAESEDDYLCDELQCP
jgi:hypothetical protein